MRPVLHAGCPRARLRRRVEVACEVVRVRDFRLVGHKVLDLSARGMLLETELPVLTGAELLVSFTTPRTGSAANRTPDRNGRSERWYDCDATVARVLHGRRRDDRCHALGIAFDGLDPFSQMVLCDHLAVVPLARGRARSKGRPGDDRRQGGPAAGL